MNGRYTERGIKGLDGYGATRWRVSPRFAIAVPDQLGDLGVLTEPGSVVAKAWEQIDRLVLRAPTEPRPGRLALVTGAGPIGMLAALLGRQRGYQVHVFDRVSAGPSRPWSRRSARPTTTGRPAPWTCARMSRSSAPAPASS